MRRFKELSSKEKMLLILAITLVIGLIFKWPKVKEGFLGTCEKLGIIKSDEKSN